tara:strand:+ start:141 stop:638 length:498 start_codon:yes stop_codon:yes gene_type:complete
MTTRFAEIKTSNNEVIRVIEEEDVINGVDVKSNPGDTSVETYLSTIVAQDSFILSQNGGVYPDTFWKQSRAYDDVGNWRRKIANISDIWDPVGETFTSQRNGAPASYVLNTTTGIYEPPVAYQIVDTGGLLVSWEEDNLRFVLRETADGPAVKYWDPSSSTYIDI